MFWQQHIQTYTQKAGHPRLSTITKPMLQKILKRSEIKPFKIKYYCGKRAPESLQFDEAGNLIIPEDSPMVHTISCDEKPGIQAISTTSGDLRPSCDAGKGCVYRDYEYKRLGTLSLLAGIDLLTGQAIPVVSETHKSSDFICLLKKLDERYPEGRFVFVFTPTHGSWLNLIESFFSKMTKQMLRGIHVDSKEELEERIYKYFDEVNQEPVVFHWTYKLDEISAEEANC